MRSAIVLTAVAALILGCTEAGALAPSASPAEIDQASPSAIPAPQQTTPPPPAPVQTATAIPRPTPAVSTPRPTPVEAARQPVVVAEQGFSTHRGRYDSDHNLSWAVIVSNPNLDAIAGRVEVAIDFLDADGELVHTVSDSWTAVLPGQLAALGDEVSYFSNPDLRTVRSMEVQVFHGEDWEPFDGVPGAFEFESIRTRTNSIGSLRTTARISSSFARDLVNPYVVAVYYDDDQIIGGGWTFADRVPSGGKVGVEIYGPSIKSPTRTEMYAHLSNLSLIGD